MVLISALGNFAHVSVPTSLAEVVEALEARKNRVVVVGGLHPGQSTNAVAALVAEKVGAEMFINATDTDGVYTEDPRRSENAELLPKVTTKELAKILANESIRAGGYDLMDPVALKLVERFTSPPEC